MNTKIIFKALALAMLMPAMLLTTACSNDDDAVNNENTANKGYALPVTVNVTREGDATRATYTDNGNGTGSFGFSAGDKLFVSGSATGAGKFAGALDYVPATGKFSGTIYTQKDYDGTADALFSAAFSRIATLLPAGYDSYNFLSISNYNTPDVAYDDVVSASTANAFVASETAKKTGVEQLSLEQVYNTYSSGFALAPSNAVLNFTISGLAAGEKAVTLITKYSGMDYDQTISGSVTPNASGVATFAIGVPNNLVIKNVANNLTVGSRNFTLPGGTALTAGKIYNIARSATGTLINLANVTENKEAQNGDILTGMLANNVKISIADGATVILNGVSINGTNDSHWAGITCLGDATIILSGTNTVKGFYEDYPGIYVPGNKTVTIQGSGSLTASSNGWAAGIGGGNTGDCGNITITGGNITATGGSGRAGIGGGSGACGNITITGGTITATGGNNAAGIGGGTDGTCGNITITSGVTRVTATKGNYAPNSIGAGGDGTCGTVTIGGTVYPDGVTTSPFIYPAPAPSYTMAAAATTSDKGKLICTAGHIHVYGEDAACTADRVAKIIYVGTNGHATYTHGLALALEDMSTKLTWDNSGANNGGNTAAEWCSAWNTSTPVTDAEWLLASKDQWNYMLGTDGAGSYTDLRDGFAPSVDGSNMKKGFYWSSTENDTDNAWNYYFGTGGEWYSSNKNYSNYNVRACLAF